MSAARWAAVAAALAGVAASAHALLHAERQRSAVTAEPSTDRPEPLHVWREVGRPAPDASFRRLQGGVVRLHDFRGKLVVLDFWTTWCSPCVEELPDLAAFDGWARGRGDVVLLSVNEDADAGVLARFLDKHRPRFTVLLPGPRDPLDVHGYPTKVLVDPAGIVRLRRHGGPVRFPELRDRVLDLLRR